MPFDALGNYIEGEEEPSIDQMRYEMSQKSIPETIRQAIQSPANKLPTYQNIADIGSGFASAGESLVRGAGSAMLGGIGDVLQGLQHSPLIPTVTDKLTLNDYLPGIEGLMPKLEQTYELPVKQQRNMSYPQARPKQEFMGIPYATSNDVLEAMPQRYTPKFGDEEANTFMENLGKNLMVAGVPVVKREIIEGLELAGRIPNMTKEGAEAFARDYANAMHGVYPETPTAGSRAADFVKASKAGAEDIGDVMARQQARRNRYETSPKSSVEVFSDLVPESRMYAVRNTGEGQMLRPTTSAGGVEPRNVDYGETEQFLKEISPALSVDRPIDIIDQYERTYMSENTPQVRQLNYDWEKFQTNKIMELYPQFSQTDAFKAIRAGYPANIIQDMKLKWFHDFVAQEKAKGAPIPTMEEYFSRAQSAHMLTKKIIPNIIQKYIGTPNDPFLESAKQGITMNPAEEFVDKYAKPTSELESARREAGFEPQGEVANKLMPVAESKLATQTQELEQLIAEQNQVGQTEGMMVPYPDGRIDPETGQVAMATNPNYAQYTNKIGAMRKVIGDTEEEIRNLKIAQSYENVSDSAIRTGQAFEYRNRIAPEEQQFYPAIFGEKPLAKPDAEREFKTPATAPFFDVNVHGLTRAGILPLAKDLVSKIMSGEIPPNQVPTLAQPHTITKFMSDIVAPRIEKEKAARLAMKDYLKNVENHFVEIVNAIPDSMKVGTNAKLLWIDDATPIEEIHQSLSDETFVLDHCIGNSGNGRGLKNLFTGDERSYIPYLDPVTKQKFQGAGMTSSYMDAVESGEKDIMMIRDDKTGMPVGTIELSKQIGDDGTNEYDIGYVSGYKNHSNKFNGIDPKYREALRDSLNLVKNEISSSDGNENRSGVYDIRNPDQLQKLTRELKIPGKTDTERNTAWKAIKKSIMDTLDGDRYFTIDSAKQAVEDYKQANPPVPAISSGFPPAGKDITERNIVMQGLSRENLNVSRQFDAARIVAENTRFANLPNTATMDEGPRTALQTLLNSEERRADTRGISDYQLFRNLQEYVDQMDRGELRFGDFGLRNGSELLELRQGLQRHADAIGQLAHYADVLQRNGFRSPLPSERVGTPEWQAYQTFIGELGIDNPQDLRTRLEDMIRHGDPREINANLDTIQIENFKHLLEIHSRAVKQAIDYPAPTAPAQERGIPLAQWSDLVLDTMNEIGATFGDATRQEVGNIMANAIGSQMDVRVNERPVQVSNFLNEQAREAANPVAVRNALRMLAGNIDQANADIQNARNAPQTVALPTLQEYGQAINSARNDIPANVWSDVSDILENINREIRDAGGLPHQQPVTVVNRLNEQADFQDQGGEPSVATGLRNLAGEIAQLVPANPPASMALANPQMVAGGVDNLTPMQRIGARVAQIQENNRDLGNAVMRMLDAHDYGRLINENPRELARALRRESEELFQAGDNEFGQAVLDVTRDIEQLRNQPNRQLVVGQEALSNSILDAMQDYGFPEVVSDRLRALQWRENLVDDPAGLVRNIRIEADAEANAGNEQLASTFYDIANLIADERGETLFTPAVPQAEPRRSSRDIALTTEGMQNVNRVDQVVALTDAIDLQLEEINDSGRGALLSLIDFYRNPNQLPDSITDHTNSFDDATRIANYLRQHAQARLDNMPQGGNQLTTAGMPTPRDVAQRIAPDSTHQNLDQRRRQVQLISEGINNEIRSLPNDMAGLERALEFYRDYDNLPTDMMSRIPSQEDAEIVLSHIRHHIVNRISNLPENRGQDLQASYERVSDEIRNTYTNNYLQQFQDGDADVRNTVLQDVADRPSVYGLARLSAQQQRDMVERLRTEGLYDPWVAEEPQRLPQDNGNDFQQMRNIEDAITQRGLRVNQNHLGISQNFDNIVQATRREFNPLVDTVNFISSLHQRANSVARNNNQEATVLSNMLRGLADDVNNQLQRQAPALPAPDPIQADLDRLYNSVSESIRTRHPTMIDSVMNSRNTRSNLADVIRTDPIRYGLENYSPDVVNLVTERLIEDGIAPAVDPVAQHYNRVEQGVNQPAGLGALDRNDSDLLRMQTTNFLNGDRNALTNLSPAQRHMAQQLTRYNEPDPTIINELDHRRLINTLVSQTYNPATDGEALIRLAETRAGMFAGLDDAQREQVIDIVNKWNFLRFPNYRPPEAGMGEDPEGHKRGGVIKRKMFMTEGGKVLTPYEQFKLDNAKLLEKPAPDPNAPRTLQERMADQAFFKNTAPRTSGGGGGGGGADLEFQGLNAKHPKALYAGGGGVRYQNPEDLGGFFDYTPSYYQNVADKIQPDGQAGGYNDATRHILASADMTRRFGEIPASLLGYGHEAWNYLEGKFNGRPQTNEDMQQDLHNNAVGRQIGKNATSFQDIVNQVPQALDVRPYQTESNKAMVRHPNEAKTPYKPFGFFSNGGIAHMNEGGLPLPDDILRALNEGRITQNQAEYIHNSRLNPVPEHWGDHMSYQDRYNESLEPKPKYVPPTEQEVRIQKFLEKQDPMRQPNVDMNREQLRQHALQTENPANFRSNPSRVGGGGGAGRGGPSADIKQIMNPRNIVYKDGGNVNIDAMRLALMKG